MTQEIMFQVPASIEKVETMADRCLKLRIDTSIELPPEEEAKIMALRNKNGWLLFKPSEIKIEDIDVPEVVPEFKSDKTPSQRLRAVIFVNWEQSTNKLKGFESYYREQMEFIINKYKEKLT